MINIFDMNNWARTLLESGSGLRDITWAIRAETKPVMVWDGFNANKYRRDIFPGYKVGRNKPDPSIFKAFDILKEIGLSLPVVQIEVDGYEADDIIATVATGDLRPHISKIWSTDLDLAGWGIPSNASSKSLGVLKEAGGRLRLYKTLVGDQSDKIPGVRGFGPAKWREMSDELKDILQEFLSGESSVFPDTFEHCREDLERYWRVVGFRDVPEDLLDAGTVVGKDNPQQVEAILARHLA